MSIEVGKTAAAFTLPDANGKKVSLKSLRGKWVVLYFYPRDNTPGCTKEACAFKEAQGDFQAADAVVIGVSGDSEESHARFARKFDLPFTLLADKDYKVCTKYGVYREKNMYGKKSMGIVRSTFIIDPNGKIVKIYPRVKVDGHAAAVLDFIRE